MAGLRRLRAGVRISIVSGVFWTVAGAAVGVVLGLQQLGWAHGPFGRIALFIAVCSLASGVAGLLGGACYASVLSARRRGDDAGALTTTRAMLAGAVGGITVQLSISFLVLPLLLRELPHVTLLGTLAGWGFFGALGAATGAAILGTARRAALPGADEDLDRIAP